MNLIEDPQEMKLDGSKILVVEDNELSQVVAKEILEYAGASVVVAEHGKQALDFLAKQSFDCVLMDIQMPVMDGLEATRIIRANANWSEMPVIALTANIDQHYRDMCMNVGMNDFLAKPIDPDLLIDTICKWL
ncbi:MAG: response regulator [Nitrosomonas sp. PRO4]|nr:response regulator [Nitrosomonas sp. PRO4]